MTTTRHVKGTQHGNHSPRNTSLDEIRRTMYEDFVIEQRHQGIFSPGEAARLLNITYAEFFTLLGKRRKFSSISAYHGTHDHMVVISNSSPLIALSSIDRLDILATLFTTVYIPNAVYQETVTNNPILPQRNRINHATGTCLQVRRPTVHRLFTRNLGDGEQGVLNLALEMHPDFILLDDKKARNEAKAYGVSCLFTTKFFQRLPAPVGLSNPTGNRGN